MFHDIKTGKAQTVQQAKDANRYPHTDAAWCHCRKCSNHDAYIDSLAARIAKASH